MFLDLLLGSRSDVSLDLFPVLAVHGDSFLVSLVLVLLPIAEVEAVVIHLPNKPVIDLLGRKISLERKLFPHSQGWHLSA